MTTAPPTRRPLAAVVSRLEALALLLLLLAPPPALAWGPEGHRAVVVLARRYLRPAAEEAAQRLLGAQSLEDASVWPDEVAHSTRPETAPWHYINIPLQATSIDLRRDCPHGDCVLVKTREFLDVLGDPRAGAARRSEALKFVLHFVADLHQPLHCEDDHDEGGNTVAVVFEGRPDNLHWVWDTGLVQEIDRDPNTLAAELARRITPRDLASWRSGSLEDWVLESHRLAQTVAYRGFGGRGARTLGRAYDDAGRAAVSLQLERAAVRLADLLNRRLP